MFTERVHPQITDEALHFATQLRQTAEQTNKNLSAIIKALANQIPQALLSPLLNTEQSPQSGEED